MTVDGTPEPVLLAGDCDHDLVEMPRVAGTDRATAKPVGVIPPKFPDPTPHRFVAHVDTGAASISSTMRRLSGNRKYSQTAMLITSGGKRWRR